MREEVRELEAAHLKSRSDGKSLAQAPGRQVMCILPQVSLTMVLSLLPNLNCSGRMTWMLRTKTWPPAVLLAVAVLVTLRRRCRRALPRL